MNSVQTLPASCMTPTEQTHASYELEPFIIPEYVSANNELNWGRLICTWQEKKENDSILSHQYAACFDGKEGGIYQDCSPTTIFIKCMAHLFTRPLFTIIKTLYHVSLYPVFHSAVTMIRHPELKEEKTRHIFRSLADIVLTPLYGIILTIASIAVLIVGPFSSESLYEGRKLLAHIERCANWGHAQTFWTLTKCFQPYPLAILEWHGSTEHSDTLYGERPIDRDLANFARARIRFKRQAFDIFTCGKTSLNKAYISPFLKTK